MGAAQKKVEKLGERENDAQDRKIKMKCPVLPSSPLQSGKWKKTEGENYEATGSGWE